MSDTIFALSSGQPPAAIAILRLSGPAAFTVVSALTGSCPPARRASLRTLRDPVDGMLLDRALVLVFPAPDSATGEDVAELHLHGGRAVIRAVERAIAQHPGLRPAEPGEFTRRALETGRIDLTEAEGLADLLTAETEMQRRTALLSAEGALRRNVERWTDRVVFLAAALEAAIDYSDEADVADEDAIVRPVREGATILADEIERLLQTPPVERLRDGLRVVFAGPPNSGKSTLFNAMTGRDAAIVSPFPGTTRDRIEAPVEREGIAWLLIDTAGLATATIDPIERIGIDRSEAAIAQADVVLWLGDDAPPRGMRTIAVHPRVDERTRSGVPNGRVAASGTQVGGTDAIWAALVKEAASLLPPGDILALNARQREICRNAADSLRDAAQNSDTLLMAEELRLTRGFFDGLTGRAGVENMLDALFGRFCIGK